MTEPTADQSPTPENVHKNIKPHSMLTDGTKLYTLEEVGKAYSAREEVRKQLHHYHNMRTLALNKRFDARGEEWMKRMPTIREQIAMVALQGLLSCPGDAAPEDIIQSAVFYADSLITALAKGKSDD